MPDKEEQRPDQTHGQEIERTHELYEKGGPAPGTRDAGEEGKDFVAHTQNDNGESGQSNTQTTDPGKQNVSNVEGRNVNVENKPGPEIEEGL